MNSINLGSTPTISEAVYENLPIFLKECVSQFTDEREKDVVLTSCLVILSGCFSDVKGKYGKDWIHPNLYCFITAPPSSGKNNMKYGRSLGKEIQKEYVEQSKKSKEKYQAQLKAWNKVAKKNKSTAENPPPKPKYPVLFIPGNTSAAAIYNHLSDSGGAGIICESEADTLSGAIKQDWGNFSHMLRCAFHHEPLTVSRAGNDTYINIEKPRLSLLLTGTPDQVSRIISSAEDGLFSRNLFYCYNKKLEWIDPTPCSDCPDLESFFDDLSLKVAKVKKILDGGNFTFSMSEAQFSALSENFNSKLQQIELFERTEAASAVYRLGQIAFRIAMLFTVLRNMDSLDAKKNHLDCRDEDCENALRLTDIYFEHTMLMFSLLPKQSTSVANPRMREFYNVLPKDKKFPRKNANELGQKIGLAQKTVGNYLKSLEEKKLIKSPAFGYYEVNPDDK